MAMPTGPDNTLIPVRKATKERLAAVKGRESFDEMLTELLRAVPPEVLRARLDARREALQTVVERRTARAQGREGVFPRSADKQLLIARLAEKRWKLWLAQGKVERLGPRRYRWNIGNPQEGPRARIRAVGRHRGAAPARARPR